MKKLRFAVLVAVVLAIFLPSRATAGEKEQLIQLQTTVQMLQDNVGRLQESFDQRMGVLKDMVAQQIDSANRMDNAIQTLQKTVSQHATETTTRVDQISGQVQALHDSVDELRARLAKLTKQLDDIEAKKPNTANPGPGATTDAPQAPPRSPVK